MGKANRNREIIRLSNEKKPATIICGKCKEEILIDITPFIKDISNIMKDKCPKCGAYLHVGILILSHTELKGLLSCIKLAINTLQPTNLNLISNSNSKGN